jgi:hypothetical protein
MEARAGHILRSGYEGDLARRQEDAEARTEISELISAGLLVGSWTCASI